MLMMIADHYGVQLAWLQAENRSALQLSEIEQYLLNIFRKLPNHSRYKILGYIERMCDEVHGIGFLNKKT